MLGIRRVFGPCVCNPVYFIIKHASDDGCSDGDTKPILNRNVNSEVCAVVAMTSSCVITYFEGAVDGVWNQD